MVNTVRLQSELEFITRNKAHHQQSEWFREFPDNACQTSGCLAGWTAIHHAKDELVIQEAQVPFKGEYVKVLYYDPIDGRDWIDLGADLLGLTWDQAETLFEGNNSLWDLWNLASIITRGEITIPEEVEAMRNEEYNVTEDEDYDWLLEN